MGEIRLQLPNETIRFEFAGDQPTAEERFKIGQIIREKQRGLKTQQATEVAQRAAKDEQMFDTKSGIRDTSFRAALSAAETAGDEEKQLRELYGMTQDDYLRDSRGRLALTPSGGQKIGVELERPTLIDESGLSRYDIVDLAGIVPEVVGGVGGAIKGAAVGSALGPLGTLAGGAIGAGLGAASGQAVEESVEALAGVQDQTAGEVAEDLQKEFVYGFLTDATLGAFGLAARGVGSTMRAGKGLTDEELEVAAKSIEMGINPTLSAIRAPSVVARQQGIVEKIFGSSPRLKQNNEIMQKKLAEYRSQVEKVGDEEAGRLLLEGTGAKAKELAEKQLEVQKSILQTLRGLGDDVGAAADKNMNLDQDVFDVLVGARNAFDQEMKAAFKPIDDLLESSVGGEKILGIGNLRSAAKDLKELEKAALAGGTMKELDSALRVIDSLGKTGNASFTQLYNARKALNDLLSRVPYSNKTQRKHINDLMRKIDSKLSVNNINATLDTLQVPEGIERATLVNASKSLDEARRVYNEGAQIFEDIEAAGIVKNLAAKAANNQTMGVDDVALDKIIRNNKPRILERALKAVEYGKSKSAKASSSEDFRKNLAGQWLNDALSSSGLSKVNDFDPTKFKPAAFAKAVKDLGKTADVLFGKEAGQVKRLAAQMEKIGLSNLKQADVDAVLAQLDEGAPLAQQLDSLVKLQRSAAEEQRSSALRSLQSGDLNQIQAAELIANKSTNATDIKKILNAFEGDEAALNKIRGNYLERLISDFGDTLTTDGKALGGFAKRLIDANEGGKLSAIFGEEMGKDMAEFARILDFNSRTAAGGDLVAANIAASPIQNLGKLARFTIIGKLLQSGPYYKQIVSDYKKLSQGLAPEEKSRLIGRLISQALAQQSQEGVNEVEEQVSAVIDSSGLGEQISQLRQQIPNNSTPLGQAAAIPPAAPVSTPTAAPNNLRQQAAQNPGIAAALGIQGATAGLLGNP